MADLLPARIEGTFDLPKVNELVLATGRDSVAAFIEFELVKLSALVSIGGNLSKAQVPFIAFELIDLYPNETIADFKICFQRGARGDYGDIFRMDGIVIRKWMNAYLEEKYQVLEKQLMAEKDNIYKPMVKPGEDPSDTAKKYLDIMANQLRPDGSKPVKTTMSKNLEYLQALRGLSEKQIEDEGQEKPKASGYRMPDIHWLEERKKERHAFQEKTVRERHPDWSEDQIQARLKELRKNEV